jgi:hypothetical protein
MQNVVSYFKRTRYIVTAQKILLNLFGIKKEWIVLNDDEFLDLHILLMDPLSEE